MKSEHPVASVIIVDKNDRGIDATLDHLKHIKSDVPFEVIVVDSSLPGKLADIKAKHPWVTWDNFPYSKNRQTPIHRNRGLELARGEIIIFIDANCIPGPNWLTAIVRDIKSGRDIVCGPVLDSSTVNLVHYHANNEKGGYVDIATTISVGFSRKVIDRIGVFDTTFPWGQDVDFFWRATDAGFRIYYDPEVVISHDWGNRKEQLSRAFDYGESRAHLFRKHWRKRHSELLRETHVWTYPVYIIGLPITYWFWPYPLLILVPLLKNLSRNPLELVVHHLAFGLGVITGAVRPWPKDSAAALKA
jgi:glycosyltransferase involved in cell wall biosynthesis